MVRPVLLIFILVSTALLIASFFVPSISMDMAGKGVENFYTIKKYPGIMIMISVAALLNLISLVFRKNRKNMAKMNWASTFIIFVAALWLISKAYFYPKLNPDDVSHLTFGVFLPLAAFVFNLLAARGNASDEKVVRDSERFR